jgi:hypothetical protein
MRSLGVGEATTPLAGCADRHGQRIACVDSERVTALGVEVVHK